MADKKPEFSSGVETIVMVECENCHYIVERDFNIKNMPENTLYVKTTNCPKCGHGVHDFYVKHKQYFYDENWNLL